ncbi:MAG TPA: hypothetical protein VKM55_07295 [Candidatus Lokiarchaeia archaeon]|nr:hypothetical protein [Candidatus Lokiarchaeia archaeon]
MPDLVVTLSYFDRKVGPTVFMEYPEKIGEEEKMTLNQIFDQTTNEGFFSHSLNTKEFVTSLNYYFEIKSDWARGLKEMLMCSLLFTEKLTSEKEHEVLSWISDFVMKMHSRTDVFKAFYSSTTKPAAVTEPVTESGAETNQTYVLVMKWLKELYYSTKEEVRQKSEEEVVANLMVNTAVYEMIKKLSKYPVRIGELKNWFDENQFNRDFDKIISMLEEQKFIFINKIGPETYVILVKDIDVFRVPPSVFLEMYEKKEEFPQEFIQFYVEAVSAYFNNYDVTNDDKLRLYKIMSMAKHYNLISELRKKPLPKSQISAILRQGPSIATRINVIEDLKQENIIDEVNVSGVQYLFLKTDINIEDKFPEYIQTALPEAQKLSRLPKRVSIAGFSPEIQQELKEVFGGDDFFTEEENIDTTLSSESLQAQEQDAIESANELDASPFDLVVDRITTRFIENKQDQETASKTKKDRTKKESK